MKITLNNNTFVLHHSRSLFWEDSSTLIISDLHIGKTAHFRKEGLPIPTGTYEYDIQRLESVLGTFKPSRVLILGDLFHADFNYETTFFRDFLDTYRNISFVLVEGNHDRHQKSLLGDLSLDLVPELVESDFRFVHEYSNSSELFTFSGHVHPVTILKGKGKDSIRLPVLAVNSNEAILPSFGSFSGGYAINKINRKFHTLYLFSESTIHIKRS